MLFLVDPTNCLPAHLMHDNKSSPYTTVAESPARVSMRSPLEPFGQSKGSSAWTASCDCLPHTRSSTHNMTQMYDPIKLVSINQHLPTTRLSYYSTFSVTCCPPRPMTDPNLVFISKYKK